MKSSSHSGIPFPLQFPATPSQQFPVAPSLLRVSAGSKERDRSCRGGVEEEVVVELDDSPGTANGRSYRFCRGSDFMFYGQTWLTTTWPLINVTVLFAKFAKRQYGRSILEQLRSRVDHEMSLFRLCRRGCRHHPSFGRRVFLALFPRNWEPMDVAPEVRTFE